MPPQEATLIGGNTAITQDTNPISALRADPNKPEPAPESLPLIQGAGYTLQDMGSLIGPHINGQPEEPYPDRQNPNRKLINLMINNPDTEILKGKVVQTVVPEDFKRITVAQFICAQFAHLKGIAEKHKAKFIKFKIPTANGWAMVRVYAYNPEGYMIGEYRAYVKTQVLAVSTGAARVSSLDTDVDLGGVVGTITATGKPKAAEVINVAKSEKKASITADAV